MLDRRAFLALSSGLLVPRRLYADTGENDRTFLFIFCAGGWDQTTVFAPLFDSPHVDMEADAQPGQAGGITFVDREDRPEVRAFFETYGAQTCLLNGFEVQAVAHERCTELLLTGTGEVGADDWATTLAGHGASGLLMPHVVVSGPVFAGDYASKVVRVGSAGQLPDLVSGAVFTQADQPVAAPASEALLDARVRERAAQWKAGAGWPERFAERYATALDQIEEISAYTDLLREDVQPDQARDLLQELALALASFENGLCRCATVQYDGIWGIGWDTHAKNEYQNLHFEELFGYLNRLMVELAARTGPGGRPLTETVTVVVLSEMGRTPLLNNWGGKHHWTSTSALIIGAGVRGGQVVGGYDELCLGLPVDLDTGETDDAGTELRASHLGATLLALGGVDPGEAVPGVPPITAILA